MYTYLGCFRANKYTFSMNDGQIAELLRRRNPWWQQGRAWRASDVTIQGAENAGFAYRPDPLNGIEIPGLYTLTGPRRVGKSLELKRKIESLIETGTDSRRIVFCPCDDFSLQDLRRLFTVGRNVLNAGGEPIWWLIDEITAIEGDWSAIVKEARDNTELAGDCVVLTGSSARGLRNATKNFAGRRGGVVRSDRLLLPAGFRAYCQMRGGFEDLLALPKIQPSGMQSQNAARLFQELSFAQERLIDVWQEFIRIGGFPLAIREFSETGDTRAFSETLWSVVEGEAFLSGAFAHRELVAFFVRLSQGLTTPINATRLARETGLQTARAVQQRIETLVISYLLWPCHQDRDLRPNYRAAPKYYFVDPALARLASFRSEMVSGPDDSQVTEQQIGACLTRALATERGDHYSTDAVMYRRTESRKEIDFVAEGLGCPVEVKYVDDSWKRPAQTLRANAKSGILATRRAFDVSGDVWAVPAPCLTWALGV